MKREHIAQEVRDVCATLEEAGHEAWVVGGCVRDLLMGTRPKDWDLATSAAPEMVQRLFRRTVPTGLKHGTVTVLARSSRRRDEPDGPLAVEVTTFRGEGSYSDGRRPDSVAFVKTIQEDLARRDFTMNAVAFRPAQQRLVDPFGGQEDLARRRIRAVGAAIERFREDGLRPVRAVRFAATLEFEVEPSTLSAIGETLDVARRVSAERLRDELLKLLAARRPSIALRLMQQTGLLDVLLPELVEGVGLTQNRSHAHDVFEHSLACVDAAPNEPVVRLGALLHDVAKPRCAAPKEGSPSEHTFYRHDAVGAELSDRILRRLRLSNQERERVVGLVGHHMFWYEPAWTDATVRRFLRRVGPDNVADLFALRAADIVARGRGEDPEVELAELRRRIDGIVAASQALSVGDLAINGADVMRALGCRPGPMVGQVLQALLERVLEEPELNERERLLALVPTTAEQLPSRGAPPRGAGGPPP
jgi:tRNA nucleotidyltransferase (CCA-adding enzyme)